MNCPVLLREVLLSLKEVLCSRSLFSVPYIFGSLRSAGVFRAAGLGLPRDGPVDRASSGAKSESPRADARGPTSTPLLVTRPRERRGRALTRSARSESARPTLSLGARVTRSQGPRARARAPPASPARARQIFTSTTADAATAAAASSVRHPAPAPDS